MGVEIAPREGTILGWTWGVALHSNNGEFVALTDPAAVLSGETEWSRPKH